MTGHVPRDAAGSPSRPTSRCLLLLSPVFESHCYLLRFKRLPKSRREPHDVTLTVVNTCQWHGVLASFAIIASLDLLLEPSRRPKGRRRLHWQPLPTLHRPRMLHLLSLWMRPDYVPRTRRHTPGDRLSPTSPLSVVRAGSTPRRSPSPCSPRFQGCVIFHSPCIQGRARGLFHSHTFLIEKIPKKMLPACQTFFRVFAFGVAG